MCIHTHTHTHSPAGSRPPRSAGHSAMYDAGTYQMLVSFGITAGPKLLDDQWIFHLTSSTWTCSQVNVFSVECILCRMCSL